MEVKEIYLILTFLQFLEGMSHQSYLMLATGPVVSNHFYYDTGDLMKCQRLYWVRTMPGKHSTHGFISGSEREN